MTEQPEPCRWHITEAERLPYLAWHAKADESQKKRVRQTRCPGCSRWIFPWEGRTTTEVLV